MMIAALLFFATLQSQIETIARQTDAVVGVAVVDRAAYDALGGQQLSGR